VVNSSWISAQAKQLFGSHDIVCLNGYKHMCRDSSKWWGLGLTSSLYDLCWCNGNTFYVGNNDDQL